MKLRLLVFLFPLLIFSQSKKDQISSLERKLSILKVENFELQEELDNCFDSQISLSSEKKNLQLELKSKIDSINSIKIHLQNKIDSIIDLYEEEEYRVNILQKEFYFFEEELTIKNQIIIEKDSLLVNLELENNELKNKLNNKSDIKGDVLSDFFLTNLYQGDDKINNQTFNLRFEGVLDSNDYGEYFTNNSYDSDESLIQKFYPTNELYLKVYSPLSKSIDYYDNWALDCNYPDEFIVYKKNNFLNGVLPKLSFIKGKLVTISNDYKKQNLSTDFLFSIDFSDSEKNNDLYKGMYFSFTKEGENLDDDNPPIFAPIIVIENRVFLVLNNALFSDLELGFKFFTMPNFSYKKQGGPYVDHYFDNDHSYAKYKYDDEDGWEECDYSDCDRYNSTYKCDRPILIEVFKKSDNFLSEKKMHISSSDYFLFELIEQE